MLISVSIFRQIAETFVSAIHQKTLQFSHFIILGDELEFGARFDSAYEEELGHVPGGRVAA